ncbi:MAG: tRNA (guanosine(37)-N1)-methyltransferase TrmD, partial [Clostridia bacterium]|nr:tRNA (guanosine(37)-N1)-methyltransferase TrmD [Clostridia bacterium]
SIIGRARKNGLIEIEYLNIRDFTTDKHKRVDDYPFGGGAGMVMQAQPVVDCIRAAMQDFPAKRIHMSPRGKPFTQAEAQRLSKEENLIILCSHYEGVDQRALDMCIDEEISMGDYVLTGGELPAMCLVDSISRLVPGVLGSSESFVDESFSDPNLLEYPQYTRPAEFEGIKVPDVLLSGHAANIAKWRREQALLVTRQRRPDLIKDEK